VAPGRLWCIKWSGFRFDFSLFDVRYIHRMYAVFQALSSQSLSQEKQTFEQDIERLNRIRDFFGDPAKRWNATRGLATFTLL
jgi:hypothetical protein